MRKKVSALLSTAILFVTLMPMTVSAGGSPVRIVETGTSYANVQVAVDNAENGQTIQLYTTCTEDVTIPDGKTVAINLNGNALKGTGDNSVITIGSGATLTLDDTSTEKTGKVTGGSANKGGGVYCAGTFIMSGGTITGNAATTYGGGVYVLDGSIFTMGGGTISDNSASTSGGGVYGASSSTLNVKGGTISKNSAKSGGGLYTYDGSINITGGTICSNNATNGGGVYDNGTFTMSGGTITQNSAVSGGGVLINAISTFKMQDGIISENSASQSGGGVLVNDLGIFEMNGGSIETNRVTEDLSGRLGGGVYNDGDFTMTAGKICNNSSRGAGGIFNKSKSMMKLLAAEGKTIEITGNEAARWEGGIANWGEMHLSGKVIIKDNTCKESAYPINLATNNAIIIDGALAGSEIYITHANSSSDSQDIGLLTSGYSSKSGGTDLNDFFNYDGPVSFAMILNNSKELEVMNVYAIINGSTAVNKEKNHGYLTLDKELAVAGGTVTVTVEPNSGYRLKSLTVKQPDKAEPDGSSITPVQNPQDKTKYTFTMPAYAVAVTAVFEEIPHIHDLVKVDGQAATETTAGWESYYKCACGALFEDADETTPITDLEAWKAEGGNGYIPPIPKYTVTVTNDGNGSATADTTSGIAGTVIKLTATPADGYEFDCWKVVSGGVTVTNSQFTIGTANVEIRACFKAIVPPEPIPPTPVLSGIIISEAPDKLTYTEGETFDATGLIVTANYNDGSRKSVKDYTFTPSGVLSVTDTAIVISYVENGETKTASLDIKVNPKEPVDYKIITGANQAIYTTANSATFASNADYSKFRFVEFDGKRLPRKYYVAKSGSTIVTLNRDFIRTLSIGNHTLTIVSTDGKASTTFKVVSPIPATGEHIRTTTLVAILMLGSGGLIILDQANKRKKNHTANQ